MAEVQKKQQDRNLLYQPQNPAYWLFLFLLIVGVIVFMKQVVIVFSSYFWVSVFAMFLWALYTIPWLFFLGHEELYDRQPVPLALLGFLWGGLIATFVMALEANTALIGIVGKLISPEFARDWGASISAPFVEELAKGLGIVMLILLARDRFRSIYDGTVIGAFTGLGFQVFEDMIYTFSAANLTASGAEWKAVLTTFLSRGFIAGLWSHAMYSALVGAGIAAFILNRGKSPQRRFLRPFLYIFLAWGLHFIWDSPWVNGISSSTWSLVVKLLIYPLLFSFGLLKAFSRKRSELSTALEEEVKKGTLSEDDASVIGSSSRTRRRLRKQYKHKSGVSGKMVHSLQKAQRSLAVALVRSSEDLELIKEKRNVVDKLTDSVKRGAAG